MKALKKNTKIHRNKKTGVLKNVKIDKEHYNYKITKRQLLLFEKQFKIFEENINKIKKYGEELNKLKKEFNINYNHI